MTPDVTQFLAYLGGQCQQVKLGTMVMVLPWNDPMRVAEKTSMLDCRSNGRVLLGVSRGLGRVEFEGCRVPMSESRERLVECAETLLHGLEQGYCQCDGNYIKQQRTDCCGFTGVFSCAGMKATVARSNLELFAREVLPELKKLGSTPLFNIEVDNPPAFARGAAKAA